MCDRSCRQPNPAFESPWAKQSADTEPMEPWSKPHNCTRLHTPRRLSDFRYGEVAVAHKRPSKHHALVMLTAERPVDTLNATLASLQHAGIARWVGPKILVSDGRYEGLPKGWQHIVSTRRLGSAVSFIRALREALASDPKLEYLTFLEDDVSMSKGALDYMKHVAIPNDVAFVSWFTYDYDYAFPRHPAMIPHPSQSPVAVLAIRPSRYFILIQACTFPRRTVERLLLCPHITEDWPKREGHDEMVAWALGDALYAVHFPIIVQHEGGPNSAVVLDRGIVKAPPGDPWAAERKSPYFKGTAFEASSITIESLVPFTTEK